MNPIYATDRATVYCGDALDVIALLSAESVDCVVTDPPYGVNWQSGVRQEAFARIEGDAPDTARALLDAVTPDIVRVTRRTRHIYTFGLPLRHELLPEKGQTQLIWDKARIGAGDLSRPWGPSFEPIFFHARAADRANAKRGGLTARLRRQSVLRVPRLNALQVKRHPTEKPVRLMRELVESSTSMDEVVLDPFAGSGSTGVAALLEGRRTVLIEIDEGYALIAAERLSATEKILEETVML